MAKSNKIRLNRIIKKYSKKKKKHIHNKHETHKIQSGGTPNPKKANYKVTFEFDRVKDLNGKKKNIWSKPKMTMVCQKFDADLNAIIDESVSGFNTYSSIAKAGTKVVGTVVLGGAIGMTVATGGLGGGLIAAAATSSVGTVAAAATAVGATSYNIGKYFYDADVKEKTEKIQKTLDDFNWCSGKGLHEFQQYMTGSGDLLNVVPEYIKVINYPELFETLSKGTSHATSGIQYIQQYSFQPLNTTWYFPTCYNYNEMEDSCEGDDNIDGDACDDALLIPHGLINLTKITDNCYGHQIPKKIVWKKIASGKPTDTKMALELAAQKQVDSYIQIRDKQCRQQWKQYEVDRINSINDCALVKGKFNPTIDVASFLKKSQLLSKAKKEKKERLKNGFLNIEKKTAAAKQSAADASAKKSAADASAKNSADAETDTQKESVVAINPNEQKLNEEDMELQVISCQEVDLMIVSILMSVNIIESNKPENKDFIDTIISNYFKSDSDNKKNLKEFEIKVELNESVLFNEENIKNLYFKQNWENNQKKGWVIDWNKEHILNILELDESIENFKKKNTESKKKKEELISKGINGVEEKKEGAEADDLEYPDWQKQLNTLVIERDKLKKSYSYMNDNVIDKIKNNLITKISYSNPLDKTVEILYGGQEAVDGVSGANHGQLDSPKIVPNNNDLTVINQDIDTHTFITLLTEKVKGTGSLTFTCIKSNVNIDLDAIIEKTKEKLIKERNEYIEESLLKASNDAEKDVLQYLTEHNWYKQYQNSSNKGINYGFNKMYFFLLHNLLDENNIVFEENNIRTANYNSFKESFPKKVLTILEHQDKIEFMGDYSKKYSEDLIYDFMGYDYLNEHVMDTEKVKLPQIPGDIIRKKKATKASLNITTSQEVIDAILFEEYYAKKQYNIITNATLLLNSEGINNPSLIQIAKKIIFITLQDHNEYEIWKNNIDTSCEMAMSENDIRKQWEEVKDNLVLQPKVIPTINNDTESFIGSGVLAYTNVKKKAQKAITNSITLLKDVAETIGLKKKDPIIEINPDFSFKEFVKDTLSNLNKLNEKEEKKTFIHFHLFNSILQHIFPDMKSNPTGSSTSPPTEFGINFNTETETTTVTTKAMNELKTNMFNTLYNKYKLYVSQKNNPKWKQTFWVYSISYDFKQKGTAGQRNKEKYIILKDIILINLVHKYLFEAIDFIIDKFKLIDGKCFIIQNYINNFNDTKTSNSFVILCNKISNYSNIIDCAQSYPSDDKKQKESGKASKSIKKLLKAGDKEVLIKEEKNIIKYMQILFELKRFWSNYNLKKIEDMATKTPIFNTSKNDYDKQSIITFLWAQRDIKSSMLQFSGVGLFTKLEWYIPNDIKLTCIRTIDLVYKENIIKLKDFYITKDATLKTTTYLQILEDKHSKDLIDHMKTFDYGFRLESLPSNELIRTKLKKKCIDIIEKNPMYSYKYLNINKIPKLDISIFSQPGVNASAALVDISKGTVTEKKYTDIAFEKIEESEMSGGGMKYIPMELI